MRILSTFALVALCVLPVRSQNKGKAQNTTQRAVKTEAELLTALDNSIWVADGTPAEKQIYVISAPWCSFCRELYRKSQSLTGQVQFRWVELDPRDPGSSDYIVEGAADPGSTVLKQMYDTHVAAPPADPAIRDNAIKYNLIVARTINPMIEGLIHAQRQGKRTETGFPVMIWQAADGVKVYDGLPEQLEPIVNAVVSRPEAAGVAPMGREFLTSKFDFQSIPEKNYYANDDGVRLFAYPDTRSQLGLILSKGAGLRGSRRVKVRGETWIELQAYRSGPGLFVRERDVH